MTSDQETQQPATSERQGRRSELLVFLVLAVLIWPVIAVGFVASYGFIVWMWQILMGPPGPPG